MLIRTFKLLTQSDIFDGILLFSAALIALLVANSTMHGQYEALLNTSIGVHIGTYHFQKDLLHWVNEGFMTFFFLLVSLEIKRELIVGELKEHKKAILPAIAALGGMAIPALCYVFFNHGDAQAMKGWAIPTATDIAFSLSVLSILGKRVPIAMRTFLTALAILDDLGAIIIIALFYTADLSFFALIAATCCLCIMLLLRQCRVQAYAPYILISIVMWLFVVQSGVHATLVGVVLAFVLPEQNGTTINSGSHISQLESQLTPWVIYLILPLFAFANSGVSFQHVNTNMLTEGIPLGIMAGLFLGKPIGIFSATWLAVKTRLATLPESINWLNVLALGALCGIGFTMSLFIGTLAFSESEVMHHATWMRLGILIGSLISGLSGYALLRLSLKKESAL